MTEGFPTIVKSRRVVPNLQPLADPKDYRIALIGEAPGEDEENHGFPFVGKSGSFLDRVLRDCGISRHHCFVGNVVQVRPPGNRIEAFEWNGPEFTNGLKQLTHDLNQFNPNLCVLLGGTGLKVARADREASITAWRGSLFRGTNINTPFYGRKSIATYHPAYVLREFSGFPLLKFDLNRARQEGGSDDLILPKRELIVDYDAATLIRLMDTWPSGLRCSVDIEGGLPHHLVNDGVKRDAKKRRHLGWKCVSICGRPTRSFTIAWWKFNEYEHAAVLQSYARLMARTDVPKVLQNALYDAFVMAYGWSIPVRSIAEDTMLKGWEVYCELPKGLSTQASIWTREPHWKDDEMYDSTGEALAIGCAKDTAVTLEICEAQDGVLQEHPKSNCHYRENVSLLVPALYMELRGIRYDQTSVAKRLKEVTETGWMDEKTGKFHESIEVVGKKICEIAGMEVRGEKGSLSAKRLAKLLYEIKGYPPQYKKVEGRIDKSKLTTDAEAILNLAKRLPDDPFLGLILRHRHLEGLVETLNIKADPDGRVRCAYNVVGTETGRFSCKTSPTGAGANLTTITKSLRSNYAADPGHDFCQCDLEGADGWTYSAHAARLGDRTMLDDYFAGLKPAKIIAMLYAFGSDINKLTRDDLKFWSKKGPFSCLEAVAGDWIYAGSKVVQHGSAYLMGIPTMQTNLMKRSFKDSGTPVYMSHADAKALQGAMFWRYPGLLTWHQWAEAALVATGELTSASGQTRTFFGRRFGPGLHETVKEYLAHEPQSNTTYATSLAMLRLWNDPSNRIVKRVGEIFWTGDGNHYRIPEGQSDLFRRLQPGSLIVEPLHQVHDANCVQWPQFLRDWSRRKMREWFDNKLTIAGIELVIPFDGTWGPSWGDMPNQL